MVQAILTFGHDALRRKARAVEKVDAGVKALVGDMLATMRQARGLGLAAEQIGHEAAVCVIDVPREAEMPEWVEANAAIPMPLVLINPRIEAQQGKCRAQEGCLSFPDVYAQITRAESVTVAFLDLDGAPQRIDAGGLLARAIQHELDHLNGVLLVDRMSPAQRVASAGNLRRLRQRSRRST